MMYKTKYDLHDDKGDKHEGARSEEGSIKAPRPNRWGQGSDDGHTHDDGLGELDESNFIQSDRQLDWEAKMQHRPQHQED